MRFVAMLLAATALLGVAGTTTDEMLRGQLQRDLDQYLRSRASVEHVTAISLSISLHGAPANINITAGSTRSGHIVTITATVAEQPVKGVPAVLVSMVKGGLNAATKSLAIEYASRGIRVNAVSPIIIRTHPEVSYAGVEWQVPLGRIGEIDDVTPAVMYLENAPYVTGEISHVDGGQSAGHW
ncbi:MAG: SDR family oxidoreductase [Candidatus Tumulicola sp.]